MGYDYDDTYEYDYDDYDDYDWSVVFDCPEVTLRNVIRLWISHFRNRWWNWRHRNDENQIPF